MNDIFSQIYNITSRESHNEKGDEGEWHLDLVHGLLGFILVIFP